MFVAGGLDAARRPDAKVTRAESVLGPLGQSIDVAVDPATIVRCNGVVQVAAGIGLALGIVPRGCAFALACSLVPTTIAGHAFWREDDQPARASQRIHFLKNLSMLGGLLIATRH
jgi:uncharacterized membrane protein YphA (DoxX/SURF4 family)